MENKKKSTKILLVGNPNVGKSTIFNQLCNRNQKTGNYSGVTVSSLKGDYIYKENKVEIIDLPGTYSVYPTSEDEVICVEYLINERSNYDGVLYVADALNFKRSLLLFEQIRDLGIPVIMVANQIDEAEKRGYSLDVQKLSEEIGVTVNLTNAKKNSGIDAVKESIHLNKFTVAEEPLFQVPAEHKSKVEEIAQKTGDKNLYKAWFQLSSTRKYVSGQHHVFQNDTNTQIKGVVPKRLQTQETLRRYDNIDQIIEKVRSKRTMLKDLLTEKLDRLMVHKFWGYVLFLVVLLVIFQSVFFLAEYPKGWIEDLFTWFSSLAATYLPEGPLNSLIAEGVLPGIGGIVVFAPQIGILMYFLYIMEDSGYMARVIFLMDRLLRPFGLNGKSIIPLVSGTACAIPAIMSARNIENTKERLITILVTPFMTCSARLPIYSIIITLVIPDEYILGIGYRALALLAMYMLGFVTALVFSFFLKKGIKNTNKSFLILDLPTYKMPLWGYNFKMALLKAWGFITGAGKVIFAVSIIIWFLSYFGPHDKFDITSHKSNVELNDSYLALMGKSIEPAISPLGYDWKMGVGILTSFAAREVFVGTMSTLYTLGDDAEDGRLIDKMKADKKADGTPLFTLATGISILVFYAFAMQCISTIAIVYKETGSKKWTFIQLIGMSGLAYLASLFVFQVLK
ncbi:ferrous iron transporter B [Elizabethkingia anophelis]|uniref:ferrous iron transport protein B n=1 Tax=Elizabethkingia anophelis TaxID=1117645 RepID=UPI000666E19F|nr:ferrous iron transport protein B [Elizabethkingia anophelis]MCT3727797.1 ferrous iron transport protein B [Elizabethkingia anophelis]MCT4319123.1 ferrous iron transport protein B [Elizabethkingia anophelis]MDV3748375.1 ferrous iron transporter B [Elizabethkingia anophelis]MDV4073005.1 ferrous iron transporter B [Elizabethkingia anophelis]